MEALEGLDDAATLCQQKIASLRREKDRRLLPRWWHSRMIASKATMRMSICARSGRDTEPVVYSKTYALLNEQQTPWLRTTSSAAPVYCDLKRLHKIVHKWCVDTYPFCTRFTHVPLSHFLPKILHTQIGNREFAENWPNQPCLWPKCGQMLAKVEARTSSRWLAGRQASSLR